MTHMRTEPEAERQEPVTAGLVGAEATDDGLALVVVEELVLEVLPALV
jgi:hypothetical protein